MNYAERNVKCAEQGSLRNIWNVNYAERNVKCTEQGSLRNMARAELRLWPAACLTLPCSTHNICHKSRILFASLTIFLTIYAIYLLHTHYLLQNLKHICYTHNICTKVCKIIASNTIYVTIFAIYLLHTKYLSQNLQYICFIHNICHNMWLYLSRFLKEFGQCWSQRRQIWKYEPHIYISKHEKSCSTWLVIFWTARNYIFWWQNCICWWKICIFLWIEIEPRSLSVKEKTTKVR